MRRARCLLTSLRSSGGAWIVALWLLTESLAVATPPHWWAAYGVFKLNPATQQPFPADDYAGANLGQLKHIASRAYAGFQARLPGGAGAALQTVIGGWSLPDTTGTRDDFAALTLGQLKQVAMPFYDRLISGGLATAYPWTNSPNPPNDFAIANLGQLKNVFSFPIPRPGDSDDDDLPDDWEMTYFGNLNLSADDDPDSDGLVNSRELGVGTSPQLWDTDADQLPDGWEVVHGYNPTNSADAVWDLDHDGLTTLQEFEAQTEPSPRFQVVDLSGPVGIEHVAATALNDGEPLTIAANAGLAADDLRWAFRLAVNGGTVAPTLIPSFAGLATGDPWSGRSLATAVNAAGDVLGTADETSGAEAFRFGAAAATLARLTEWTFPTFIPSGVSEPSGGALVVGNYADADGSLFAFYVGNEFGVYGGVDPFNNRLGRSSVPKVGITPNGLIFGTFIDAIHLDHHGFTWDGYYDGYAVLTLPGEEIAERPTPTSIEAMNRAGDLLATAYPLGSSADGVPFLRVSSDLNPIYLGTLGGLSVVGRGINDARQIVGISNTLDGAHHGFFWQETMPGSATGVMRDLNDLILDPGLWEIVGATAINTHGDIIGQALKFDAAHPAGRPTAVLLRPMSLDTDGDGLLDDWERFYFGGLGSSAGQDPDQDGLPNVREFAVGTNPTLFDTDGDGAGDGWEVKYGFNPLDPSDMGGDSDQDGLPDLAEARLGTNPRSSDTDDDGVGDAEEVANHTDPLNPDSDGDGLTDGKELQLGTNPNLRDTDGDGMPDRWEFENGRDPLDPSDGSQDSDQDGISDLSESQSGTNPLGADSDSDGIPDGWERAVGINPLDPTDGTIEPAGEDGLSYLELYQAGVIPSTVGQGHPPGRVFFLSQRSKTVSFDVPTVSNGPPHLVYYLIEQPTDPHQPDGFNSNADLGYNNFDPGDPRDYPIPRRTQIDEVEYLAHTGDPAYLAVEQFESDPSTPPVYQQQGRLAMSNNDPAFPPANIQAPAYSPAAARAALDHYPFGASPGFGWEGDGAGGVLAKTAFSYYVPAVPAVPATDDSPFIPGTPPSATTTWLDLDLQTNVPPRSGEATSRTFLVVSSVDGVTEVLGSITMSVATYPTFTIAPYKEEQFNAVIAVVPPYYTVQLKPFHPPGALEATVSLLPVEMSSDRATINPKYRGSASNPYRCNNINHIAAGEKIEGALTIYHKAVRDEEGKTEDFDVTLKVAQIGNVTWTKSSGPHSGTLVDSSSASAIFRNPKKGGLYDFALSVGAQTAIGKLQLWLPVAGPDISSYWESEIAYFKNTWGPAYRTNLNDRTVLLTLNPPGRWVAKKELASLDMLRLGGHLDWNGEILGDETPCGGPISTPGNRLTLHGFVISWSKRNNMIYALIGREMGLPEGTLISAGHLINIVSSGGPDSAETVESYRAGFDLFNGISLDNVMKARGLKMHQPNGWDQWEWPSHETTEQGLQRVADQELQNLIQ